MKKLITLFTLVIVLASTNPALALTPYERAVALMNTINTPQVTTSYQLASSVTTCIDLTTDLSREDKGNKPEQVTKLQNFLYPKYLQEPATGYFGVLTDAAVKKFQAEYPNEIATPTGYVGPLTRNIIKSLTCGNSQTTTGTKSTTASGPVSTVPSYQSGGWWLSPVPTPTTGPGSTGSTDPIKTTTTGTTPTATTTPPNCEQYAGVIPGDTRKVTSTLLGTPRRVFMVDLSAEALQQYDTNIAGRFNDFTNFFVTNKSAEHGTRPRLSLRSGEALVVPFKTAAEYNYTPRIEYYTLETPQTADGTIIMSISPCPADFTSPFFAGTPDWKGDVSIAGNGLGKYCISTAPATAASFEVTLGNPGGYACNLEPNKTYYFNITAGFSDLDGRKAGTMLPYIGRMNEGSPVESTMTIDEIAMDRSGRPGTPLSYIPKAIKGQDTFYDEVRREQAKIFERNRNRTGGGPNYISEWRTGSLPR